MVTPFYNGTKLINSVNNDNKFIIPAHVIMIKKDQEIKEGIETSRVSSSDGPNSMGYHRNTLLYSDEGKSKAYKPDKNKKIILVNPENKFLFHAQVIMNSRDQGRNLGP